MNTKIKVDLCAYTNSSEVLNHTVEVLYRSEGQIRKAALKAGKDFWASYDKALIRDIIVDFIHYPEDPDHEDEAHEEEQ